MAAGGSRARAERAIVIAVLAVRGTFVVQLILAIIDGAARVDRPGLFVGLGLAMVLESVLLGAFLLHRRVVTRAVSLVDLAVVVGMILMQPLYSSPVDRVGTWVAWGFAAGAAGAPVAGVGLPRLRAAVAGGLLLAVAYLIVSQPAGSETGMGWTALINSVALVGFTTGSWVTAWFIRDLAGTADAAQAKVAELAHQDAQRQRLLLHDYASVMGTLSRPGLAAAVESRVREQASRGSHQIRAFLARDDILAVTETAVADRVSLAGVLRQVAEEFTDLPLTVNVDLAARIRVSEAVGQALALGVRTLLHNVRRYAHATMVTVHADQLPDGCWEVTVQDDGVGFDPTRPYGFGLRVQAGSALREAGLSVEVDSAPQEGSRITIVGPPAEGRS